jgi:hypothetical protein
MSKHKHRKGFREDQVMLSEAYSNIYDRRQQLDEIAPLVAAGLGALAAGALASSGDEEQPAWWQKIKVIEISDVDAEGSAGDAWISKAEIDGTELTDDQYETVNNDRDFIEAITRPLIDGDPEIASGKAYTGPPAIDFEEDIVDYHPGYGPEEGDEDIDLDVKDRARAYKNLEGGEGKYL